MISVIVPAYNVSNYIADCLDSVLSQNIGSSYYEVIVVDDCSPYGEKTIVDTYLEKYSNIRYIRHEVNKRQGGARNTGIRAAQGEYVMFLDADDCIMYQNTFSVLKGCIEKFKSVVLRSTALESFPSDITYQQIKDIYNGEFLCESLDFVQWRKSALFGCSSCATLYKRDFLLENNLFFRENVWFEDSDWVQKTMFYAGKIDFIDFAYYAYRQSPNSTTRGYSIPAFEGNVDGVVETFKFYIENISLEDPFWDVLHEGFVCDLINLLKVSRNYPTLVSYRILKKLKYSGLTQLKSKSYTKNIILKLIHYTPLLPIVAVKFMVSVKRFFKRLR